MRSDEVFETLITKEQKSPHRLLDSIGIRIDVSSLPASPAHVLCRNALYGTGWLSTLWCRYIRPIVAKQRQVRAEQAYDSARLLLQQQFLNELIDRAMDKACEPAISQG